MMRTMLYEAAQSMLHSKKWSWLPRDEKGGRGLGAPVGRDHAPYVDRWH
jgi:hypothetical protein